MIWASTEHENQTEDNDAEDGQDFDRGQPKLKLAKEFDTEIIDAYDCNKENCNPDTRVDSIRS